MNTTEIIVIQSGEYFVDTDSNYSVPPVFCTLGYAKDFDSKEDAELYVERYKEYLINPVKIQTIKFTTEIVEHFKNKEA